MTVAAFLVAVLALLLAPGPTNTLVALAGARGGLHRAARLIPAELLGYMTAIVPLALIGQRLLDRWPVAAIILKGAAAAWVLFLAVKLWATPCHAGAPAVATARRVYMTTVLNPKALLVSLVLLPVPASPAFPLRLGLFAACVIGVALLWGSGGSLIRRGEASGARLQLLQRVAAIWLAILSGTLVAGSVLA